MSEKIPDEIVEQLRKAAKTRDVREFDKTLNRHKRDLPDDLLEAAEDKEILEETMELINNNLTDVYTDGVRLKMEHCNVDEHNNGKVH